MAVKESPLWRITLYPHTAVPYRKYDAFVVADLMADLLQGAPSDWQGLLVRGASANQWQDWGRLGNDLQLNNVGFARFLPSGEVSFSVQPGQQGGGGFYVRPTLNPLDAQGDDLGSYGTGSNNSQVRLKAKRGTWRVTKATADNGARRVFSATVPNDGAAIATEEDWTRGRGLLLDIDCLSSGQTTNELPEITIPVSPTLRAVGRQGLPWVLEAGTPSDGEETTWKVWKTMDQVVFDARGKNYKVWFYLLGGRLCWQVNEHTRWLTDAQGNATTPQGANSAGAPKAKPVAPLLGGAPVEVEVKRMRASVEFSAREYTGGSSTGTVSRRVYRQSNAAMRNVTLNANGVGHLPPGSAMQVTPNATGSYITYTAALTASEDGLLSPLLSQVLLVYEPVWVGGSGGGIDVSSAVNRATLSMAMPPTQAGAEGSVEFDVGLLNQIPGAANVTKDYCPVSIDTKWRYSDGSVDENWTGLFWGYLFGEQGGQNEFNSASISFTLRDPICRLRDPAAIVDGSCYPLDWAYYKKMADADAASQADAETFFVKVRDENGRVINARPLTYQERSFYAWEAVKEILKIFLGPTEANRLAVYVRDDEPPLLTFDYLSKAWLPSSLVVVNEIFQQSQAAGSLALASQEGCIFKPPYGEDALAWINRFCQDVFAMFFYGYTDRSSLGYPRPIFGTRAEVLASTSVVHQVSGVDPSKLLLAGVSYETRPETDVNRILVWSNPWDTENQYPLTPAFVQGEARFGPLHPRAQERSWARTKVLETKLIRSAQAAKVAAALALKELDGDTFVFPRLSFAFGDARVLPGDVFTLSDAGLLGLEDESYRAERIEHEYTKGHDNEGTTWTMTATTNTMSAREKAAL